MELKPDKNKRSKSLFICTANFSYELCVFLEYENGISQDKIKAVAFLIFRKGNRVNAVIEGNGFR